MAFSLLSIPKRIHKTLSNLRTGVVLLILVGVASALGTFILQRPATDPDKLARAYSPATLLWLDRLGLTDIFHAWWFMTLLGLVSLSIILVSIDRFPNAWRFYARPYRKTDSHFRSAVQNKIELPITNAEDGLNAAERALKKSGWPVERIADRNEPSLFSERHRFSVMAVYIVHASLLLIFAGAIIDGVFGFSGFMALQKGQTSNMIRTTYRRDQAASLQLEVLRSRARKLCRRLTQTLVVEADRSAERTGSRVEGDRGQRSAHSSRTALLPSQLRNHRQSGWIEGRRHCRRRRFTRDDISR